MKIKEYTLRALKSPFGILGGVVLGISAGLYSPSLGQSLGPVGDVFLNLMKMCILPIVITSISLSLAQFLSAKTKVSIFKMLLIFAAIVLISGAIGAGTAIVTTPGKGIDPTSSETLKEVVDKASMTERALNEPVVPKLEKGIFAFLLNAIPQNIFAALAENQTFQIIIFSVIFGVALGVFTQPDNPLMSILDTVYVIFVKIFNVIILLLPIAIFCLMARDATVIGTDMLIGMAGFIAKFYTAFFILFVLSAVIIIIRTQTSLVKSMNIMQYPIFIALATHSSIAAIPAAINSMREFGIDKSLTNMLIPLGTVLGRYGNIMYFSFAAIFVTQLYNIPLGFMEYIYIVVISAFAGIATAGQTGTLTLPLFGIILEPLGVPVSAVLVLFLAIDPIIDLGRTLINVYTNCAIVTMIAPMPSKTQHEPEPKLQLQQATPTVKGG